MHAIAVPRHLGLGRSANIHLTNHFGILYASILCDSIRPLEFYF